MQIQIIGGPCPKCGQQGIFNCCSEEPSPMDKEMPLRFRVLLGGEKHPNGSVRRYQYGVYFPVTDLVVGDMGGRGTGKPNGVEWIDT